MSLKRGEIVDLAKDLENKEIEVIYKPRADEGLYDGDYWINRHAITLTLDYHIDEVEKIIIVRRKPK